MFYNLPAAAAYILLGLLSENAVVVSTDAVRSDDDVGTTSIPFLSTELQQHVAVEQYRQRVVVECAALQPRHHAEEPTFVHWVLPDLTIVSNVSNTDDELHVLSYNYSIVIPRIRSKQMGDYLCYVLVSKKDSLQVGRYSRATVYRRRPPVWQTYHENFVMALSVGFACLSVSTLCCLATSYRWLFSRHRLSPLSACISGHESGVDCTHAVQSSLNEGSVTKMNDKMQPVKNKNNGKQGDEHHCVRSDDEKRGDHVTVIRLSDVQQNYDRDAATVDRHTVSTAKPLGQETAF